MGQHARRYPAPQFKELSISVDVLEELIKLSRLTVTQIAHLVKREHPELSYPTNHISSSIWAALRCRHNPSLRRRSLSWVAFLAETCGFRLSTELTWQLEKVADVEPPLVSRKTHVRANPRALNLRHQKLLKLIQKCQATNTPLPSLSKISLRLQCTKQAISLMLKSMRTKGYPVPPSLYEIFYLPPARPKEKPIQKRRVDQLWSSRSMQTWIIKHPKNKWVREILVSKGEVRRVRSVSTTTAALVIRN